MSKDESTKDESILDTLIDLMGYSFIGIAMEYNKWNDKYNGVKDEVWQNVILAEFQRLFNKKLQAYGTKDLQNLDQITQRMHEKLYRIENLNKSTNNSLQVCRDSGAKQHPLPTPKKAGDVGFDLYTKEDMVIKPNSITPTDVPTGVRVKIPDGHWGLVINRSSTPRKTGLVVVPGVIDNGYTGELFACCFNYTDRDIKVKAGDRLAQVIILPAVVPTVVEVDTLPETERGETGFGSTS